MRQVVAEYSYSSTIVVSIWFFVLQHLPHHCQANAASSSLFFDGRPRIHAQRGAICVA
jgi:hypothetical protein